MNQFSMGDGSQLTIKVVGPNGQEDGFMADNTMLLEFDNAVTIDGFVNMQFKTDNNPEQTTIQIENMDSGEIVQEFRFELPRHVYKEDFTLMDAGCYRINILDSEGDGLGSGSVFIFKDSFGNKFFTGNSSTQFKSKLSYELYCDGSVAVNEHVASDCVIAPNPSCGNFELTLGDGVWQVAVYDLSGRVIYRNDQFTNGPISLDGFMSGIYFLKAANGSKELVEKLMLY